MSPAYEVTAVADQVRDWAYKNGTQMKSYRVTLRNDAGREMTGVEWSREADSGPPKPGDKTPDGSSVDPSAPYGPKLVVPKRGSGGGGGGFNRSKPPEERRSIAMQSSSARAVELMRIAVDAGVYKPEDINDLSRDALIVAGKFFDRVMQAEAGQ